MKRYGSLLIVASMAVPIAAIAQPAKTQAKAKRGEVRPPDEVMKRAINERLATLRTAIDGLRARSVDDAILVEIDVFAKAAEWIARHNEYYDDQAKQTVAVIDRGIERAAQAADAPWRNTTGTSVVRAYRSKVDGSVQPYAVTVPASYGRDRKQSWRLDVVLHGRDAVLTEVKFLNTFRAKPAAKEAEFVRIDIFGRTNNAYRWAGETDVFEALESFIAEEAKAGRPNAIDRRRIVLHGFSMGGAGSWHLGLHHPSKWAAIGPGAGFTTTKGYTKLPEPLPSYVEKCLHIYDAVDYAENAAAVPVIAYGGANDPQLQAAKNIEARVKPLGIPMTLFVAPDTEHKLIPEYEQKMEAEYHKHAGPGRGRPAFPDEIRFVTYTLKYNVNDWVELLGLERHHDRASVVANRDGQNVRLTIQNISQFRVRLPEEVKVPCPVIVNGDSVLATSHDVVLKRMPNRAKSGGAYSWQQIQRPDIDHGKVPGLQGPIDDAFTTAFLCVRGTGTPRHPAVHKYAMDNLDRFRAEWDKYLRGELPVKDDNAVTDDDIRTKNLILFGDPGSNRLIAKLFTSPIASTVPVSWTADRVELAGHTADAATALPVFIQRNPLNSARYVVLNSGHTFHADAFQGTNALLYPRLGDYALIKLRPTEKDPLGIEVVTAGLFNEMWSVK